MSMNSFSFKKDSRHRQELEEEVSEVINLYQDGDVFDANYSKYFNEINFKPVDLESLRYDWLDGAHGRRRTPRFSLKLTVLICNHLKAFRTQSENVSLRGLLLKDTLPEEFSRHGFDVVLIKETAEEKKSYLLFRGKAVEGPIRTPRVLFEELAPDSEMQLIKLVEDLTPLA